MNNRRKMGKIAGRYKLIQAYKTDPNKNEASRAERIKT